MKPYVSEYYDLSLNEYMEYKYNKRFGGWKVLLYLIDKGLSISLKEEIHYYSGYGVIFDCFGYSTITAATYRIKAAGGYSVLAHPGELIDSTDISHF